MRFLATREQRDFARSLDAMLTAARTPTAIRAWAAGDPSPGRALWSRLAEVGVFALAVPEPYEGMGPLPVELATAFVELGRHGMPGPVVETVAASALLAELARRGEDGPAKRLLPGIAMGGTIATLPPAVGGPGYALDADVADLVLAVRGDELWLAPGHEGVRASADPARRLALPAPGGELLAAGPAVTAAVAQAGGWAVLATAAQSLGVGLTLLDRTVAYAKERRQFGTEIGSFQAVKHRLADTLIALEFARPLLFGAALTFESADLAAAKVTAGEAACTAARTALQIHGAIGYTEELDLSLWLRKARPLRDAWGTPSWCRARVLDAYDGGS
ncbi:acyl-CoA/acyl-ACP dehydrogenase [Streptomyces sp. Je 1-79]|uniref:acyl-CoA dehydrogenase family protein n=1 Tax=Streptomyces sp. Je 1-79 TaxID=2943847 RepID=UPI0021A31776|nr:acyl-CoA dehydrogenase family protein [Streptomyces sp. Je 1-79]MCT4355162.1 acyl-CoA/acyl-ACP dehydrogenase [Streptomyces sp. Je 1-79]